MNEQDQPSPNPNRTPPPIQPNQPTAQARPVHLESHVVQRLREAYKPLDGSATPLATTDGLLKDPMRIVYELMEGRSTKVLLQLWGVAILGLAAYGLVVGMFSGGAQLWAVPLKVTGGTLFSALICLPSLYIFAALSGAEVHLKGVLGLIAAAIGLQALLLIGFAPVSWVFTVSTESSGLMGSLHFLIWITAMLFGLRVIYNGLRLQQRVRGDVMFFWFFIFIIVSLQMGTTLRPLIGEFEPGIFAEEKRFFLDHWFRPSSRS